MKMKTAAFVLSLFSLMASPSVLRAETLAEAAAAAGTDWMIGSWATEDGNASISYTWKLDNYAVAVVLKFGDRQAEGMIARKPGSDEVLYVAADNRGGLSKGKWIEFNDNPTLVSIHTNAEGTERKMAAEHIKTDADTMTVKVYGVGDDGKPEGAVLREVVFKRKK
jgi:hypothetical protein